MTDPKAPRSHGGYLRLANALALCLLICNLCAAPLWMSKACADPPSQPETGPLSGDFFTATWQSMHSTLFGSVPAGQETAFYSTETVITDTGEYEGENNVGQPITLDVIRHYIVNDDKFSTEMTTTELNQREESGEEQGLFWATVSGPNGSMNIVGASMAWKESGVTTSGFVPLSDHDALAAFYLAGDPTTTADDFTFSMLSETADPNEPTWPDGEPVACEMCANGALWCPGLDPAVRDAQGVLALCIAAATARLALALAAAIGALVVATKGCLLTPEPAALTACLGLVLTGSALVYAGALLLYLIDMAECMAAYLLAYNAAAAVACAGPQ